jgi:hypothetical protein
LRVLEGRGIVSAVGQYRARLRAHIGSLTADALGDWSFGALDALLDDPAVVDADVAATLAAGDVEFDLQVHADDMLGAVRVSTAALSRATAASTPAGAGSPPEIEHAEVDRVPIPA